MRLNLGVAVLAAKYTRAAAEFSSVVPRRAIGQAVDLIVHIRRSSTGRQVEIIVRVEGLEHDRYQLAAV